jgi:hypothetical protein
MFTDTEVEHAIRRTANKFRHLPSATDPLQHEKTHRYVSGVLLNERKGITPGSAQ